MVFYADFQLDVALTKFLFAFSKYVNVFDMGCTTVKAWSQKDYFEPVINIVKDAYVLHFPEIAEYFNIIVVTEHSI